jgi:hypothetical protein
MLCSMLLLEACCVGNQSAGGVKLRRQLPVAAAEVCCANRVKCRLAPALKPSWLASCCACLSSACKATAEEEVPWVSIAPQHQ